MRRWNRAREARIVIAIDPGPKQSALMVLCDCSIGRAVFFPRIWENLQVAKWLGDRSPMFAMDVVCEGIQSFGMPVGAEVFETCEWIGAFKHITESSGRQFHKVYRKDVKMHLCGSPRAKDPNIRQALLDLFGGKDAVGTKKNPGPLYGIKSHCWSALAVGVTFLDTHAAERVETFGGAENG